METSNLKHVDCLSKHLISEETLVKMPVKKYHYGGTKLDGKRTIAARYTQGNSLITIDFVMASQKLAIVTKNDRKAFVAVLLLLLAYLNVPTSFVLLYWHIWYAPIIGFIICWAVLQIRRLILADIVYKSATASKDAMDEYTKCGIIASEIMTNQEMKDLGLWPHNGSPIIK